MYFSRKHWRFILSAEEIGRLPFLVVHYEEWKEAITELEYNPLYFYPEEVIKVADERGHDQQYRYVVPSYDFHVLMEDIVNCSKLGIKMPKLKDEYD